ncbi:MAG: starch synthase [Saprospiraceae bacterium]|jgi:starch synthase
MSKKKVLHISTECYPVAKAGGMADVVGSLPIYQSAQGWTPSVVTPRYLLPWYEKHTFRKVYSGNFQMEGREIHYEVQRVKKDALPFDYYAIDLPGLFERDSIYLDEDGHGFGDEAERNLAFQRAVLGWLSAGESNFDLLHCHDHQVGFVPFFIKNVSEFQVLKGTPTFYTIHNGAYNSRYPWSRRALLPEFDINLRQQLDWGGAIDSVATAMRFSDHINSVSPTYLEEMKAGLPPLQFMSEQEPDRFSGILNGIDNEVWDPKSDELLTHHYKGSWDDFKQKNKEEILTGLYRSGDVPLISFIGRFAHQKGADLLVPAIEMILAKFGFVNFFILGSGDNFIEKKVQDLRDKYSERVACYIGYNEALAHKVYAASDFLVMPSRFEPCGLNQMFAMRYGTLPIARMTGGLVDTVVDFDNNGVGVAFLYDSVGDLALALSRALYLYKNQERYIAVREEASKQDYSWTNSAKEYAKIYNELIQNK